MIAPLGVLRPALPWLALAGLGLSLAGWATLERRGRQSAEHRAAVASAELAANAAALAELQRHAAATTSALERQAAATAARVARDTATRRIIDAAPPSVACSAAVPVRAALDSLRTRPAAASSGAAPGPAAQPAGLPAAAGAAGGGRR